MRRMFLIAVVVSAPALAETPRPDWRLLFRDADPRGAVYYDINSVWSRGAERSITARFVFDDVKVGDVAEIVARVEIDCRSRTFGTRAARGYDPRGSEVYSFELPETRARRGATPGGGAA